MFPPLSLLNVQMQKHNLLINSSLLAAMQFFFFPLWQTFSTEIIECFQEIILIYAKHLLHLLISETKWKLYLITAILQWPQHQQGKTKTQVYQTRKHKKKPSGSKVPVSASNINHCLMGHEPNCLTSKQTRPVTKAFSTSAW